MTDKTQSEPCRICKKPASEHASDGCNHNHAIHDHDFAVTNKTQAGPQVKPHELCDFITDHGGTVRLDNTAFNEFSHKVWDTWEDGYKHGVDSLSPDKTQDQIEELREREVLIDFDAAEECSRLHFLYGEQLMATAIKNVKRKGRWSATVQDIHDAKNELEVRPWPIIRKTD